MQHVSTTLHSLFGHSTFRPGQYECIHRILTHHASTLLVLPTGGGKSLCYQLPAYHMHGMTLVISPLIALMQDQVTRLPHGLMGACWNSSQSQVSVT